MSQVDLRGEGWDAFKSGGGVMEPTWQSDDGRVRLYLGDCRDVLPHLTCVDAVVTDPPYGVGLQAKRTKHGEHEVDTKYADGKELVISEVIPRFAAWRDRATRAVVTPGLRCLTHYPPPDDFGGVYQPNGAGRGPWGFTCFHPVLYYGKSPTNHHCQKPTTVRATHWISDKSIDHPCPKPDEWMEWMVEMASVPGEMVADPFMGSGTTGVVCVRLGRRFVGVEREPAFFNDARNRIQDALGMEVKGKDGTTQRRMQFGMDVNGV